MNTPPNFAAPNADTVSNGTFQAASSADKDPVLNAGSFEPETIIEGKRVKSWHCLDTTHTQYIGGYSYRSVRIQFWDGSFLYATEVRPPIAKVKSTISGQYIQVEFPKHLPDRGATNED